MLAPLFHLATELLHFLLELLHLLAAELLAELVHLLLNLLHLFGVEPEVLHAVAEFFGLGGERFQHVGINRWHLLGDDNVIAGTKDVFHVERATMPGVDLEGKGLLFFVAKDGDLDGLALVGAEGAVPVGGGRDGIGADLENDVEGLEAGGGGFAFLRSA